MGAVQQTQTLHAAGAGTTRCSELVTAPVPAPAVGQWGGNQCPPVWCSQGLLLALPPVQGAVFLLLCHVWGDRDALGHVYSLQGVASYGGLQFPHHGCVPRRQPCPLPSRTGAKPPPSTQGCAGTPKHIRTGGFCTQGQSPQQEPHPDRQTGLNPGERQPKAGGLAPEVTACLQFQRASPGFNSSARHRKAALGSYGT